MVAIDGPAGAGKSTLARRLAEALGWTYLDTGAMYRALTWRALAEGVALDDAEALGALARRTAVHLAPDGRVSVDGEEVTDRIRGPEVNEAVSLVARVPAVREVMVGHQRRFARDNERVVAEGRDIGTVVFPDASVKVFLDAAPRERAERRLAETPGADAAGLSAMQAALEQRDRLDSEREVAPLRPAHDAWPLDTTGMTLDEVFEAVRSRVRSAIRHRA